MSVAIITGLAGLIGSESVHFVARLGFDIVGIDKNIRSFFFGCCEVYNIGGSRHSNCSMLEVIAMSEKLTDKKLNYTYTDENRLGDSDVKKFQSHFPQL